MANIRKSPTKLFTMRVRDDVKLFIESLEKETRNRTIISIIEKSVDFKDFLLKKHLQENENQPSLF